MRELGVMVVVGVCVFDDSMIRLGRRIGEWRI